MRVDIKLEGIEKFIEKYNIQKITKAISSALKRAIKSGKTVASDEIRNKRGFNLMKSDLDRKIRITTRPMEGEISVAGKPILLSYFKPREITTGKRIKKKKGKGASAFELIQSRARSGDAGVQVQIMKGKITLLRNGSFMGRDIAGIFIGKGKGGTPLVFGREAGTNKLIAYKVYSEHFMFKKVLDTVAQRVIEQWQKEWANQVKQLESGTATWLDV